MKMNSFKWQRYDPINRTSYPGLQSLGEITISNFFCLYTFFLIETFFLQTLCINLCSVLLIGKYTVISYRTPSLSNNIGFGIYDIFL